jgi:hypothetical protein
MERLISRGATGQDVRAVQDALNYHVRRGAPLTVDGKFGSLTDARTREFQKANGLKVDGIVGPNTRRVLFEVSVVSLTLALMPRLRLTPPPLLGGTPGGSFSLPPLFPPLQLPGFSQPVSTHLQLPFLPQLPLGQRFSIRPAARQLLPASAVPPVSMFNLTLRVPTRKDPLDPTVRARQQAVELIEELPIDAPFKALLLSKIPTDKITPPGGGFSWGAEPLFKPDSGFGVKGNAEFTVKVTGGASTLPTVVLGAWGEGQIFLDLQSRQGQARPRAELEGQLVLGAAGTF